MRARVSIGGLAISLTLLLAPQAGAATVVNGDFEAGSLAGWVPVEPTEGTGNWFSYTGTKPPIAPFEVQAPPQGLFAAISDQPGPGTHVLYQDVALEAGRTHTLSMLVYYQSGAAIKSPDSLSAFEGPQNQQYRVDVMKPASSTYSVSPSDILAPVYRTIEGAATKVAPTSVSVSLTPFAGQTVRIRLAEVDNQGIFNASADAISIASSPPPPSPPSNAFTLGKLTLNKKKGTGQLEVKVPGPGTLTLTDAGAGGAKKPATTSKTKKRTAAIKKATLAVTAAGVVKLNLKPTGSGKKTLREKGKLPFRVTVKFTPTGGTAASQNFKGKLKKG